ncbi:phospholipid/cholesterol/gamma-HCH transport system substrate-binding protein [Amycolatopsis arida]|uniref:Phospholipid/cholesterol/gamma-HCH transport system substrate-binding protein n=1 Tax=Amycolatopsis arida TaxID=587909 RepID=A0A1I5VBW3_9PSEU|nr:MCE family protein [Amycolatopsis arida]TDX91222.1 phospholipid/cholesterol/gamma-HCH transport system substrate-binding protein [Amycolatopsis arida]SFQ04950.1 phospholipid/cholesterol/gamma-HCH transport system substrate-binding protein [Amycolatopsis arida]
MRSFRERDLTLLGVVSTVLAGLAVLAALNSDELPLIGSGGVTYVAEFAEAAGIDDTVEVRATGVKVGEVEEVALAGDRIRVEFTVAGVPVGDRSTVSIEIKTLLGQKYLAVHPAGDRPQDPGTPIPRERTRVPYDLGTVGNDLAATVGEIDADGLARSFRVLAETFAGSPRHVRDALDGVSALSEAIAARDGELARLLRNTNQVSGVLAGRDEQVTALLRDGEALLAEIQHRKDAIGRLLAATVRLADEVRGTVADNTEQLGPVLAELGRVTDLLQRNQDHLERGLANLAPFARLANNALGNGRWFEVYLCGLLPPTVEVGGLTVNPQGCRPPYGGGQ